MPTLAINLHRRPCLGWLSPLGIGVVVALVLAGPALAQPQGAGAPHATRTVQSFAELEESLLQAIRSHNFAAVEQLLDEDFQMIVAQQPDSPVVREDWLESLRKAGAGDWAVQHLSVRELGSVAVVGFVLRATAAQRNVPALYVVDTWQRAGPQWRLVTRHVAPATGARRGIPGDAPTTSIQKKY